MSAENLGEQFLHQRDPKLHTSKFVQLEQIEKKKAGEKTTQKPAEKLADWMRVLEKTHLGHRDDPRVLERIKKSYRKQYVIQPEDIPESYFENQRRLAREQGHGDIEITEEARNQLSEVIVSDQKSTLDNWVDYLTSSDSDSFPTWVKYWSFNGMLRLSSYDKEKHIFRKRDKGTVAPFPDLNREALAYVVDMVVKKIKQEQISDGLESPELQKLLQGANFGKLYAYAIEKVTPTEVNELLNTQGEWVKYSQGSDHMPLVQSLQGHGTGWCTAGEQTAKAQLQGGDFFVYYSFDKQGNAAIPRVAIRMHGKEIAEVRGVAHEQNLDPFIGNVVDEKLKGFPDGKRYKKKTADMKRLTELENRREKGESLSKEDVRFLYEVEDKIEGFGFQKDPRIEELRNQRNLKEDMSILFECDKSQIACDTQEINEKTDTYVGQLEPGIFDLIEQYNIKNIYIKLPEGKIEKAEIQTYDIQIGGKTKNQLIQELNNENINYDPDIFELIDSNNIYFESSKDIRQEKLVTVRVRHLGFTDEATMEEIHERGEELGLELCQPDTGPYFRLQYSGEDWIVIAMKGLNYPEGGTYVLDLRKERKLYLHSGSPNSNFFGMFKFAFRLGKGLKSPKSNGGR
jgi:hypothetical protein